MCGILLFSLIRSNWGGGQLFEHLSPPMICFGSNLFKECQSYSHWGTPNYRLTVWVLCLFYHFSFIYRSKKGAWQGQQNVQYFGDFAEGWSFVRCPFSLSLHTQERSHLKMIGKVSQVGTPLCAPHVFGRNENPTFQRLFHTSQPLL